MKLKGKGINLQALVESGSYLIFSLLLYRLTASGRYLYYVTPRMKPYLYGLSFLMLLWAVVEARHILTPRYKARLSRTFVLIFPILLLLSPPPPPDGSSMVRNFDHTGFSLSTKTSLADRAGNRDSAGAYGRENGYQDSGGAYSGEAGYQDSEDAYGREDGYQDSEDAYGREDDYRDTENDGEDSGDSEGGSSQEAGGAGQDGSEKNEKISLKGLDEKAKTITIADEDYYAWMVELGTNPDRYKDYTVSAKGFIYRDSEIEKRCNFALVRLSMWCCAADMSPVGFLVDYDGKVTFEKNEWVVVTGSFEVNKDGSLHLKAKSIEAGKKPEEEYIYPF